MIIDDLVKKPGSWLASDRDTEIVISSRVRLARNVREFAFPEWANEAERVQVCHDLRTVLEKDSPVTKPVIMDMANLSPVDKEVLKERHLISKEFVSKGNGSMLVVSEDERIAVMVNEEDHIRLQVMTPGLDLKSIWKKINSVDSRLEQRVDYAFSSRLGYLTACPSNVGTGLRASVMMHLPGLRLMNEIESVVKGLHGIGFEVRGLLGEGTDASGNMFQISNRMTLGETEESIIDHLSGIVNDVLGHEKNARARALEQKKAIVQDYVCRAFGILSNARMLASVEAVEMLSALRFGVELDIVDNFAIVDVNEVMLLTQPGHLQKIAQKLLSVEERDRFRAEIIRDKIKNVEIKE